jgi:hypothetical protein
MAQATSSVDGYLSHIDWSTFNGKQAALGFTPYNSTNPSGYISGNQTITLGGILAGSGTTSITASAASGYYMPSTADESNWNGKQNALGFTPYNATNPAGYISSSALTPYALLAGATFSGAIAAPNVTDSALTSGNCVQASTAGILTTVSGPCGISTGSVTVTGSPTSGDITEFSGATSITKATSAHIQTAIGSGVYDISGAAAARQAAYTNLTSIGSLANASGWLHNDGAGAFAYSTPTAANVGAEPALGNPGTNGYLLSSTTLGVRSWIAPYSYTLPTATSSILGGVKPDGTSILNTAGVLSATAASVGAQAALSGTGFVKISGTTISYDNSTYANLTANNIFTGTTNSFSGSAGSIPVLIENITPAISSLNQSTPALALSGQYWNGSASAGDEWTIYSNLGTGTNPTSTLNFNHSAGTSGVVSVAFPANVTVGGSQVLTSSGISGMTATQVPIAATATTITSSKALAGSGSGITTGPTSSTSGNLVSFTGAGGQAADSGIAASNVFQLPSLTSGSVLYSNGSTIAQDNSNFFWDATNHRLGIGTTSPAAALDVLTTNPLALNLTSSAYATTFYLNNTSAAGHNWALESTGTGSGFGTGLFALWDATASIEPISFSSTAVTTYVPLTVTATGNSSFAGNVGIGTTLPTHKLEVNGTFQSGTATLGAGSTASNGSTQQTICLADGTGCPSLNNTIQGGIILTTATSDSTTLTYSSAYNAASCVFSPTDSTATLLTILPYLTSLATTGSVSVTINHAATVGNGATYNIVCSIWHST